MDTCRAACAARKASPAATAAANIDGAPSLTVAVCCRSGNTYCIWPASSTSGRPLKRASTGSTYDSSTAAGWWASQGKLLVPPSWGAAGTTCKVRCSSCPTTSQGAAQTAANADGAQAADCLRAGRTCDAAAAVRSQLAGLQVQEWRKLLRNHGAAPRLDVSPNLQAHAGPCMISVGPCQWHAAASAANMRA